MPEKNAANEKQPVGAHGPIYAELLVKSRELAEKDRSVDEVNRILTHMLKIANQLPGEAQRSPSSKSSRLEPSRDRPRVPSGGACCTIACLC